jgi:hypothetical protein
MERIALPQTGLIRLNNPAYFLLLRIALYTRMALWVTAAVLWPGNVLSPTIHRLRTPAARGPRLRKPELRRTCGSPPTMPW